MSGLPYSPNFYLIASMLPNHISTPLILSSRAARRHRFLPPFRNLSDPTSRRRSSPVKLWPLAAILLLGSGSYYLLVQARLGQSPKPESEKLLPRE